MNGGEGTRTILPGDVKADDIFFKLSLQKIGGGQVPDVRDGDEARLERVAVIVEYLLGFVALAHRFEAMGSGDEPILGPGFDYDGRMQYPFREDTLLEAPDVVAIKFALSIANHDARDRYDGH